MKWYTILAFVESAVILSALVWAAFNYRKADSWEKVTINLTIVMINASICVGNVILVLVLHLKRGY